MAYNNMPVIIPLLATGYLLTIYLLLTLAQWTMKSSHYAANSLSDAYAPYLSTEANPQKDDVDRWSLRNLSILAPSMKHEVTASQEMASEPACELAAPNAAMGSFCDITINITNHDSIQGQKVQEASSVG